MLKYIIHTYANVLSILLSIMLCIMLKYIIHYNVFKHTYYLCSMYIYILWMHSILQPMYNPIYRLITTIHSTA